MAGNISKLSLLFSFVVLNVSRMTSVSSLSRERYAAFLQSEMNAEVGF